MMPIAYLMLHGGVVQAWTGLKGLGAPKQRRTGDRSRPIRTSCRPTSRTATTQCSPNLQH